MNKHKWFSVLALLALTLGIFPMAGSVSLAQGNSRTFPETGHTVKGLFLTYWNEHGGLAQQGFPISEELQEISDTDGKTYTMQYFERAVFEMHPENQPPFNVLLSLLGAFYYNQKYAGNAPGQHTNPNNARKFNETGKTIGGAFRQYWEAHGGLAQQGYPISDEFSEVSNTDGKTYTVQYFQRAVFEYHPEFANTPNAVLLSLLGVFFYNQKHGGTVPTPQPQQPTPTTAPNAPTATPTRAPVGATNQVLFFKGSGAGQTALVDQEGTIFYQKTFQHNTADWTNVTSIGGGYVVFYKFGGGGRVGRIDPDGTYHDLVVGIGFGAGYTNVVALGNSIVAFFNPTTTNVAVGRINVDGSYIGLKTTTIGGGNSLFYQGAKVVAPMPGYLLFYMDRGSSGNPTSDNLVAKIANDGTYTGLSVPAGVSGWTHLINTHNSYILYYSTTTGIAAYASVGADGSIAMHDNHVFGPGWTSLADNDNGVMLAYNSNTGDAATRRTDYYTNYTELKSYNGPTALDKGWTNVIPIR